MQCSASLFVNNVHINSVFEVDKRGDFVILCSHHEDVEAGQISGIDIGSNFLQIPKKFYMSIERCIQNWGESLNIFFIDPNFYLVLDVSLVQFFVPFNCAIDEPGCVLDVQLKEIFFITEAEMVEDGVALRIFVLPGIDGGVFFQVLLHFEGVGAAKNEFGNLFLTFHYYR